MEVKIEPGCIACGLCAATCPSVFRIGGEGVAEVYASPTEADAAAVREAAQGCPVSVIEVAE